MLIAEFIKKRVLHIASPSETGIKAQREASVHFWWSMKEHKKDSPFFPINKKNERK